MATYLDDFTTLTPAAVLPVQHLAARGAMQPERRLLAAMLEDALTTARRVEAPSKRRRRSPRREARAWIFSEDVRWPFSFLNVCAMLGLDPHYVRRGLLQAVEPLGRSRPRTRIHSGSRTRMFVDQGPRVSQVS